MENYILLLSGSLTLFLIGIYALINKKNGLKIIIAIELLLISANMVFISSSYTENKFIGFKTQPYVLISLAIGGPIIAIGLFLLALVYKKQKNIDVSELKSLRW